MDAQRRRVNDDVRTLLEILKKVTLFENAVDQPVALLQRMRPAYGFVSFDQHLVAGVEEQDACFHTKIIQMAEHCGQIGEIIAGTHIHDCRKLMDVGSGGHHHVDQRHQQFGRHVIDHIPAHILNTVGRM